jgi:hypothetical protein
MRMIAIATKTIGVRGTIMFSLISSPLQEKGELIIQEGRRAAIKGCSKAAYAGGLSNALRCVSGC